MIQYNTIHNLSQKGLMGEGEMIKKKKEKKEIFWIKSQNKISVNKI